LKWLLQKDAVIPRIKRIFFNNGRDIQHSLGIPFQAWPEDDIQGSVSAGKYGVGAAVRILEALEARGLSSVLYGCMISSSEPVQLAQGGMVQFISPSVFVLRRFADRWEKERQLKRDASKRVKYAAAPRCQDSLHELMDEPLMLDSSVTNGASLAFLFEFKGNRLAFLGDAWATECVDGLRALGYSQERPFEADLVKLRHHGSPRNLFEELVRTLRAPCYLVSTKPPASAYGQKVTVARLLKSVEPLTVILSCSIDNSFLAFIHCRQLKIRCGNR